MISALRLETTGGIVGRLGGRPATVDVGALDAATRARVDELVRAAGHASAAAAGPGARRDAQSYRITVEHSDGSRDVLSATDGDVSESFARLRDWIREHARA